MWRNLSDKITFLSFEATSEKAGSSEKVKHLRDHLSWTKRQTSASCLVSPLHSCIAQINLSVCFGDITAPACAAAPLSAGATFIISQVTHHVVCSGTQSWGLCSRDRHSHLIYLFPWCPSNVVICEYVFVWTCAVNHLQVRDTLVLKQLFILVWCYFSAYLGNPAALNHPEHLQYAV